MDIQDIIKNVELHLKTNDFPFFRKCLKKLKSKNKHITNVYDDPYIMTSIKINILHEKGYKIYFTYQKPKNLCYREFNMSNSTFAKLMAQCEFIHGDENFCKNKKWKKEQDIFYTVFAKKYDQNVFFTTDKLYEIGSVVLGIDSLVLLEHQNFENFCKIWHSSYHHVEYMRKMIRAYLKIIAKLDWHDKERVMIFSGMVRQMLGTTYTADIDTIIVLPERNIKDVEKKIIDRYETIEDFDYHILTDDKEWHKQKGKVLKYQKEWLTHMLPQLGGAEDIFEVICNPVHHFHYMGMKFISVEHTKQRMISRKTAGVFPDAIMLKELNGIDIMDKLCIPRMQLTQGKVKIYTDKEVKYLYKSIRKMLKMWYRRSMDIEKIKEHIVPCTEKHATIYRGKVPFDEDTAQIKKFHTDIKRHYILKYAKHANFLIDVGSGRCRDSDFWNEAKIRQVVAIEPSRASCKKAIGRLKVRKFRTRVNVINGQGDESWKEDQKYSFIYRKTPADCITFQFTIHYMMEKFDILMNNINSVCKKGTIIIILFVDGNYTYEQLQKYNNRVEVRNAQEPIFGVYTLHKSEDKKQIQTLIYFKGTYGVQQGSVEYLVFPSDLIGKFKENNFKLLERINFLDLDIESKKGMTNLQKQVSKFYTGIVLQKQ